MKIPSLQDYTYYLLRSLRHEFQLPTDFYNIVLNSMAAIPKPSNLEENILNHRKIFLCYLELT